MRGPVSGRALANAMRSHAGIRPQRVDLVASLEPAFASPKPVSEYLPVGQNSQASQIAEYKARFVGTKPADEPITSGLP